MNRIKRYEAHTPLELGVSWCLTFIWHSYDMCWTTKTNFQKQYIFSFVSTLLRTLFDAYVTIVQHVLDNSGNCPKFIYIFSLV